MSILSSLIQLTFIDYITISLIMKKILSFFSVFLLTVSVSFAKEESDYVSFTAHSELISSDADAQTHRITLSVTNNCDMAGVQFKFKMPDGMSLAQEQVNYTEFSLYEAAKGAFIVYFQVQPDGTYYWYATFFDNNNSIVTVSPGTYTVGCFDVICNTNYEDAPVIDFTECCIVEPVGDYNSYYDDPFSITLVTDVDPAVVAGLCPDSNHPHIIDMGEAGKWACCNVGASAPWEYGGYYAWGETEEKDNYSFSTYIHCDGSEDTCHDIGEDISGTEYDVAHVTWGDDWCMPNVSQIGTLENCSGEWTAVNGINGRIFTAPNGGSIFLPAAGYRWNPPGWYGDIFHLGTEGCYWTSSLYDISDSAMDFQFDDGTHLYGNSRSRGQSVRPIISEKTENVPFLLISHEEQGVTYKLYKKNNLTDTHVNADGWTFYKSDLTMEVTKNGDTQSYLVSDDLYLCEGDGQPLCMALDFNTRTIHIFSNSKSDDDSYYMDGYYFVSPLDDISFTSEYLFNHNWGWMPYFTYTDGKLELQHFSYAGYYAMTSSKNDSGEWSTEEMEDIDPGDFETRWQEHGSVLVIGVEDNSDVAFSVVGSTDETPVIHTGTDDFMSINMDNQTDIIMVEFYMELPEGIHIVMDEDGYYIVDLNRKRSNKHVLEVSKGSNGLYHFLCYSNSNNALKGNTGELFSVNFVCDDNVEAGIYQGRITGITLADAQLNGITLRDLTFNIEVTNYELGDVNGDQLINGLDVILTVNHIMGRSSDAFSWRAADFDGNGIVNGLDLVELVDMVMSQMEPQHVKARDAKAQNGYQAAMLRLDNNNGDVSLVVESSDSYILVQYILQLSDGQTLNSISAGADHVVTYKEIGNNRYAVICYSMSNEPFESNDQVMTISVNGKGGVSVSDALLINTDMQQFYLADAVSGEATGINDIAGEFRHPGNIYSIDGKLIRKNTTSTDNLPYGIYLINGKKFIKR